MAGSRHGPGVSSLNPIGAPDTKRLIDASRERDKPSRQRRPDIERFPQRVQELLTGGGAATRGWLGGEPQIEAG